MATVYDYGRLREDLDEYNRLTREQEELINKVSRELNKNLNNEALETLTGSRTGDNIKDMIISVKATTEQLLESSSKEAKVIAELVDKVEEYSKKDETNSAGTRVK